MYSICRIIMIYRNTGFLKSEKIIEQQLKPNLEAGELSRALRIKGGVKPEKIEDDVIYLNKVSTILQPVKLLQKRWSFLLF